MTKCWCSKQKQLVLHWQDGRISKVYDLSKHKWLTVKVEWALILILDLVLPLRLLPGPFENFDQKALYLTLQRKNCLSYYLLYLFFQMTCQQQFFLFCQPKIEYPQKQWLNRGFERISLFFWYLQCESLSFIWKTLYQRFKAKVILVESWRLGFFLA